MSQLMRIGKKAEMPPPGEAREFAIGDKVVCVANVNGELSAMDNVCLHRGGPMGQGIVEGDKVVCPWHGWQYDAKTGAVSHNPEVRLQIYPIRAEGGDVLVEISS